MLVTLEGRLPQPDQYGALPEPSDDTRGTVRLWDAGTGRQLRTLLEGQVSDFYPSPTGDALAIRSGTSAHS